MKYFIILYVFFSLSGYTFSQNLSGSENITHSSIKDKSVSIHSENNSSIPNLSLLNGYDPTTNEDYVGCFIANNVPADGIEEPNNWKVNSQIVSYSTKEEKSNRLGTNASFDLKFGISKGNGSIEMFKTSNNQKTILEVLFRVSAERIRRLRNDIVINKLTTPNNCPNFFVKEVIENFTLLVKYKYTSNESNILKTLSTSVNASGTWGEASIELQKFEERNHQSVRIEKDLEFTSSDYLDPNSSKSIEDILRPLLALDSETQLDPNEISEAATLWLANFLSGNNSIKGDVIDFEIQSVSNDNLATTSFIDEQKRLWDLESNLLNILTQVETAKQALINKNNYFRIKIPIKAINALALSQNKTIEQIKNLEPFSQLKQFEYLIGDHIALVRLLRKKGWKISLPEVNINGDDLRSYSKSSLPKWNLPSKTFINSYEQSVRLIIDEIAETVMLKDFIEINDSFSPKIEFIRATLRPTDPDHRKWATHQRYFLKLDTRIDGFRPINVRYRPLDVQYPGQDLNSEDFKFLKDWSVLPQDISSGNSTFETKFLVNADDSWSNSSKRASYMLHAKKIEIKFKLEGFEKEFITLSPNPDIATWAWWGWKPEMNSEYDGE